MAILSVSLSPPAGAQPAIYDLSITKEDTPDPVEVGQNVHFFVNVSNVGTGPAALVWMNETIPAGTTFVSVTPSAGCTVDAAWVNCTAAAIAPAGAVGWEIVLTANVPGDLVNGASTGSTSRIAEQNFNNNAVRSRTQVLPTPADLHVVKTDRVDPVIAGSQITYVVNVTNEGGSPASNVVIEDTIPAGTTFVSVTPSAGCSGPSSGVLACSIGTLGPGASFEIEVVVDAGRAGEKTNTASASTEDFERDTQDNSDTETTTVLPLPVVDLAVTKDDVVDPVYAGDNITYLINVTNVGRNAAENVTVTDTLPAGVTLLSVTPPTGCSRSPGQFTCNIGTLAAGATYQLVVNVSADTAGPKVNGVSVDVPRPQVDLERSNNAQRERTDVLLRPPTGLSCVAQADEDVLLTWSPVTGATSYDVYRRNDSLPFALLATTTGTSYEDTTSVPGTTYTYVVVARDGAIESARSEECTATAIPFFPGAIGFGFALLGATAIYAAMRRRRQA